MKKVFIEYNPYRIKTKITVDGKPLPESSKLLDLIDNGDESQARLQEWVEELPDRLRLEENDNDFDVTFHGTLMDYDDVAEVFTRAFNEGKLKAKLTRQPAKETEDKENLIDNIFEEIQNGPFEELKSEDIKNAFENEKNSDFPVCVVATMSAGKSTLINSMLGTKLMPSKQEACTAIITRIKDNDNNNWEAEVYGKDGQFLESDGELTYEIMKRLNDDERVSEIDADGDIPFVQSDDVSLVLIDTPGPNNMRNQEHRKVQEEYLGKSSKALILYVMEGTFGSDDDNALLDRVADSMSVGGKQSKDRFIFVVNKMDDRRKEDGDTADTLKRVKGYLEDHGIYNANVFPAAALPALDIRMLKAGSDLDEDTIDETELKIKKLNRNETLHLEKYASLPGSLKRKIDAELKAAQDKDDAEEQALIHTGVPSVEAAIRQYVQKYAKTAKVKNIADTFMGRLESAGSFENAKKELASNQEQSEKIASVISSITEKIDDAKNAKKFKDAVDDAVLKVNDDAQDLIDGIIEKYQEKIRGKIVDYGDNEFEISEVEDEVDRLQRYAKNLESGLRQDLDDLLQKELMDTSQALLDEYKKKLVNLTDEIDLSSISNGSIDPLKFMKGSIDLLSDFSKNKYVKTKKVADGTEQVKNTNKKWYKIWTWFQPSYYTVTKYKEVKYVKASELAQGFLAPAQKAIYDTGDEAEKYVKKESLSISEHYKKEFMRLDDVLKDKLDELKQYATEKDKAEERIKDSEEKLKWLDNIKAEVDSALDI